MLRKENDTNKKIMQTLLENQQQLIQNNQQMKASVTAKMSKKERINNKPSNNPSNNTKKSDESKNVLLEIYVQKLVPKVSLIYLY